MNAGTFLALHLALVHEGIVGSGRIIDAAIERGWIVRDPFGSVIDARTETYYSVTPEGEAAAVQVVA